MFVSKTAEFMLISVERVYKSDYTADLILNW